MIQRSITALVLLAIAGLVITWGGIWMLLWVWILAIACAYEMFEMLTKKGLKPQRWIGYIGISVIMLIAYFDTQLAIWTHPVTKLAALGVVASAITELGYRKIWIPSTHWLATLRVTTLVSLTFTYIFLLRAGHNGLINFLFCILIVWVTDSLALVGGRLFGRTPLSQISPKKTLEGSIIGLLGGLGVAWLFIYSLATYWNHHLNPTFYLSIALGVGIVSQIGDLHESLFKRHFGVKDSSGLLPGHGGVYDRADSTMLIVPLAFYLFN